MTNDVSRRKGRGVRGLAPQSVDSRVSAMAQQPGGAEPRPCDEESKKERTRISRGRGGPGKAAVEKKIDAAQIWKEIADLAIPQLELTPFERAVYWHLLRHSRLEGKQRLRFSIDRLARGACLTTWMVRKTVRGLVAKGVLLLAERSKRGHLIEVRLPTEIPAMRGRKPAEHEARDEQKAVTLEEVDFLRTAEMRKAIFAREGRRCFYCLRRLTSAVRCIDHVIPQVRNGGNSYRNLVSTCTECNSEKGGKDAKEFVRWLYRENRLTGREMNERLNALERLAEGKLRPELTILPKADALSAARGGE